MIMTGAEGIGFNPRTRKGCDAVQRTIKRHRSGFNPRTRKGCDDWFLEQLGYTHKFQSTHPQGVRHRALIPLEVLQLVSIHAPARGATLPGLPGIRTKAVSIHAPARGATFPVLRYFLSGLFQSTHPQGVRPITWLLRCMHSCFNPRTRKGCDFTSPPSSIQPPVFQSTHPQGVRPHIPHFDNVLTYVSIHAPARGATCLHLFSLGVIVGFNPRTRKGCDRRL